MKTEAQLETSPADPAGPVAGADDPGARSTVTLRYRAIPPFELEYATGDEIVREIQVTGAYDRYIIDMLTAPQFQRAYGPLHAVLDIGANIGPYAIALARHAAANARVWAVEGNVETARILAGNVRRNGLRTVQVIARAAMRDPVPVVERPPVGESSQSTFEAGPADNEGRATTIDQICRDAERVDLIKVDVNGLDIDVLLGGAETIGRCKPVLLLEFVPHSITPESYREFVELVWAHGYMASFFRGHAFGCCEPMSRRMLDATYDCWRSLDRQSWMNLLFLPRSRKRT